MNFAETAERAGEIKSNRLDKTLPLRLPKYHQRVIIPCTSEPGG